MTRLLRLSLVFVIMAAMVFAVGLLLTAPLPASAHSAHFTTDILPLPTTEFSATLRLPADRTVLAVGQTLRLTADLSVVEGCGYPIWELTVAEDTEGEPVFAHIEPPKDAIGPGVSFPSVWTFRALRPGAAEFAAQTFGEGICEQGEWFWHYESARTNAVLVLDLPYRLYVPTVSRP